MTASQDIAGFEAPPEEAPAPSGVSQPKQPGKIFTFYSFKGGVGRSMALANLAVLVAARGKKVLVIDFDLEAPGLEHFYHAHDAGLSSRLKKAPGVIDFLSAKPADWRKAATPINLDPEKLATLGGREYDPELYQLDIIHSGKASRPDEKYTEAVQQLDWTSLYREADIGTHFGKLRAEWIDKYDYVFIDSRTGVTDIGDLCTVVLPDHLVLLFVTNQQNIDGIASTYARAVSEHAKIPLERAKLTALPILSRDEFYSEYERSGEWRAKSARELTDIFSDWLNEDVTAHEAFQKVFIPYFAIWSFGEALPVLDRPEELSNPASITAAYARISRLVMNDLDWSSLDAVADPSEIAQSRVAQKESIQLERAELEAQINQQRQALDKEREAVSSLRKTRSFWASVAAAIAGVAVIGYLLSSQIKTDTKELESLKTQVALANNQAALAKDEVAHTKEQLASARASEIGLEKRLASQDLSLSDQQSRIAELDKSLKAARDDAARAQSEVKIATQARADAETKAARAMTNAVAATAKAKADAVAATAQARTELVVAQRASKKAEAELRSQRLELRRFQKQLTTLQVENRNCRTLKSPPRKKKPGTLAIDRKTFEIVSSNYIEDNKACASVLRKFKSRIQKTIK